MSIEYELMTERGNLMRGKLVELAEWINSPVLPAESEAWLSEDDDETARLMLDRHKLLLTMHNMDMDGSRLAELESWDTRTFLRSIRAISRVNDGGRPTGPIVRLTRKVKAWSDEPDELALRNAMVRQLANHMVTRSYLDEWRCQLSKAISESRDPRVRQLGATLCELIAQFQRSTE